MAEASAGAGGRRWTIRQWLLDTGPVPPAVHLALLRSLYGTLPIYIGGVIATLSVSLILAMRIGTPVFYIWAGIELTIAAARFAVLLRCRREIVHRRPGPSLLYAWLSVAWACGIGFGAFIAVRSGDWVAALVACVSSAAMLGGICFRYFAMPRLVCAMLIAMAVPGALACFLSGEPILWLAGVQIPIYVLAMTSAARHMHRMMVKALCAERDQRHRARHDALTGLLNRSGFAEAVARQPAADPLTCFFIDLDGFKRVNDSLGHGAGDALLAMVAERLRDCAGADAILGRPGGDEFLVVLPIGDAEAARARGADFARAISGMPYIVSGQGVFIGASVGAALRPRHGQELEQLIAMADAALYRAKDSGCCACVVAGDPEATIEDCAVSRTSVLPPLQLARG